LQGSISFGLQLGSSTSQNPKQDNVVFRVEDEGRFFVNKPNTFNVESREELSGEEEEKFYKKAFETSLI
jgi:hypothetical protein